MRVIVKKDENYLNKKIKKRTRVIEKRMEHLNKIVTEAAEHNMSYGHYIEKLRLEGKF